MSPFFARFYKKTKIKTLPTRAGRSAAARRTRNSSTGIQRSRSHQIKLHQLWGYLSTGHGGLQAFFLPFPFFPENPASFPSGAKKERTLRAISSHLRRKGGHIVCPPPMFPISQCLPRADTQYIFPHVRRMRNTRHKWGRFRTRENTDLLQTPNLQQVRHGFQPATSSLPKNARNFAV